MITTWLEKKNVSKQFSYNVLANKFKLKEYQEEVENNLINQIIRDIKIFLNF